MMFCTINLCPIKPATDQPHQTIKHSSSLTGENPVSAFFQQARAVIQPMESVNVMESWEAVLPSLFMRGWLSSLYHLLKCTHMPYMFQLGTATAGLCHSHGPGDERRFWKKEVKVSLLLDSLKVSCIHLDGVLGKFSFSTAENRVPSSLREICQHIHKSHNHWAAPAFPCRESGVCIRAGTKMLRPFSKPWPLGARRRWKVIMECMEWFNKVQTGLSQLNSFVELCQSIYIF